MAQFGLQILKCPAAMTAEALDLLYRKVPSTLRDRLIAQMLGEAERGELDLSGLWVAKKRSGQIAGAILTQSLAGKAAAVWPPEVRSTWHRSDLAAAMVQEVLADFRASGFKLVQAVLDESTDAQAGRDLENGGLQRVTELLHLERDTATPLEFARPPAIGDNAIAQEDVIQTDPAPAIASPADFLWRPFDASVDAEFRSVLQATYSGSLDMPELEGARSLDDLLEGYRAARSFTADRWRLGHVLGDPEAAAVLLLTESPGRKVWEVTYLGLTPACAAAASAVPSSPACARPRPQPRPLARACRRRPQQTGITPLRFGRLHLASDERSIWRYSKPPYTGGTLSTRFFIN